MNEYDKLIELSQQVEDAKTAYRDMARTRSLAYYDLWMTGVPDSHIVSELETRGYKISRAMVAIHIRRAREWRRKMS